MEGQDLHNENSLSEFFPVPIGGLFLQQGPLLGGHGRDHSRTSRVQSKLINDIYSGLPSVNTPIMNLTQYNILEPTKGITFFNSDFKNDFKNDPTKLLPFTIMVTID